MNYLTLEKRLELATIVTQENWLGDTPISMFGGKNGHFGHFSLIATKSAFCRISSCAGTRLFYCWSRPGALSAFGPWAMGTRCEVRWHSATPVRDNRNPVFCCRYSTSEGTSAVCATGNFHSRTRLSKHAVMIPRSSAQKTVRVTVSG